MTVDLKVLRPCEKRPCPGDFFTFAMPGPVYGFGRVIRGDVACPSGNTRNAVLVYVYSVAIPEKTLPARRVLNRENLLLPPLLISPELWRDGYFETLGNASLEPEDVLECHVFREVDRTAGLMEVYRYRDEDCRAVSVPREPVGEFRVIDARWFSYRMLERFQLRDLGRAREAELRASGEL